MRISPLVRFDGIAFHTEIDDKHIVNDPIEEIKRLIEGKKAFKRYFREMLDKQFSRPGGLNYNIKYILSQYGEKEVVLVRFGSSEEAGDLIKLHL